MTYTLSPTDTVAAVARRCYELAPALMVRALLALEDGSARTMPNDDAEASYNSNPRLSDAWRYRRRRIRLALGIG